ncbi:hypothetical protein SLEP1_g43927 [Rubroshorea leprosula]|uniref:Uncharacterized protein n=1 Tax=Rubroshorea leprosula TaxID=152421 RepID=A0AAV5LEK3_9ROSI|nr:hypothetical protein SLEP1_g43927 [Rubroshorea leprosula]
MIGTVLIGIMTSRERVMDHPDEDGDGAESGLAPPHPTFGLWLTHERSRFNAYR